MLQPVSPPEEGYAWFTYRGHTYWLRQSDFAISIACPICEKRSAVNRFKVGVEIDETPGPHKGRLTLSKPITCPEPACGWSVTIKQGVAKDRC